VFSPVEGTIVYKKMVMNNQATRNSRAMMDKEGRLVDIPWDMLEDGVEYWQVGIFMTPLNNHHLLHPLTMGNNIETKDYQGDLLPMMNPIDGITPWRTFHNFYAKHMNDFIGYNKRRAYKILGTNIPKPIVFCMILEKYVSKITDHDYLLNSRKVLGFVHRGSQVDMFIPIRGYTLSSSLHDGSKVDFNSTIAVIR
jgi:hypothetical protein